MGALFPALRLPLCRFVSISVIELEQVKLRLLTGVEFKKQTFDHS